MRFHCSVEKCLPPAFQPRQNLQLPPQMTFGCQKIWPIGAYARNHGPPRRSADAVSYPRQAWLSAGGGESRQPSVSGSVPLSWMNAPHTTSHRKKVLRTEATSWVCTGQRSKRAAPSCHTVSMLLRQARRAELRHRARAAGHSAFGEASNRSPNPPAEGG